MVTYYPLSTPHYPLPAIHYPLLLLLHQLYRIGHDHPGLRLVGHLHDRGIRRKIKGPQVIPSCVGRFQLHACLFVSVIVMNDVMIFAFIIRPSPSAKPTGFLKHVHKNVIIAIFAHRDVPGATAQQRLEMVCLATESDKQLLVDDCELRRERPSYTVETLEVLRAELGSEARLFLIVGWDAFCSLPNWYRWESLLELASLVVLQRPEQDQELPEVLKDLLAARSVGDASVMTAPHGEILCLAQTPLAISATHIRSLISTGHSPRYLLPDSVLGYIETRRLYQSPNNRK